MGHRSDADALLRKRLKVPPEDATFDFADYEELAYRGEGSLGTVYAARTADGRPVALKVFAKAIKAGNDKELRRFLQERRVFQGLDHPGVVKVHDVGVSEDVPYFAMELVEGKTLAALFALDGEARPSRDVLVAIVERMCEAVAYLHEKNIVLRDLKPENAIVRDADGQPVIVELGLAKDLGGDLRLTAGTEARLPTAPRYTAVEVQNDPASATVRSDVFSLGVLLYQATCGRLPFEGRNLLEVLQAMGTKTPPAPSSIDPSSPLALDAVCARALSREPENRQRGARALADEIAAATRVSSHGKGDGKGDVTSSAPVPRRGVLARISGLFRRDRPRPDGA